MAGDSDLFDALKLLMTAQFDEVVQLAEVPLEYLPGPNTAPATRARELMQWAGQAASQRARLENALQRVREPRRPDTRLAPAPSVAPIPPGWEAAYLTAIHDELGRISIPAPAADHTKTVPLETVYVELELQPAADPGKRLEPAWLLTRKRVVISGRPGSGKSTLLRHIALLSAHARAGGRTEPGRTVPDDPRSAASLLPIWIDLVDAAARLGDDLRHELVGWTSWLPVVASAAWLTESQTEALLRSGGVLLLLDRLDEVPDRGQRQRLALAAKRLQEESSPLSRPNHVIVACRTRGIEGSSWVAEYEEVRIRAMSRETRDTYLGAWCQQICGAAAQEALLTIQDAVRNSPPLAELAATPQIATMLAGLADGGPMPMQRVSLYEGFIAAVTATERMSAYSTPDEIRQYLVALAHAMQTTSETGELSLGRARDVLRAQSASPRLIDDLALHTGLVTIRRKISGSDLGAVVGFEHRTLQEFLAARYFAEHVEELLDHVADPVWIETLAMTAGVLALTDGGELREFLDAVVGEPAQTSDPVEQERALVEWAPRVAAASVCLTEVAAMEVADWSLAPVLAAQDRILPALPGLALHNRLRIADGLGSIRDPRLSAAERWIDIAAGDFRRGADHPDAWEQERPACRVALRRFRIQRWPVTVEEYQQFIRDGAGYSTDRWWAWEGWDWRARHRIEEPDGWEQMQPRSNYPVTGVSWWEAAAFCAWLAAEAGGAIAGWQPALPTEAQWERAARGADDGDLPDRRFPWGDTWDESASALANHAGIGLEAVCPVGLFAADTSPDGVWDMAGNVAERCLDGFAPYQPDPGPDPVCHDYRHGHVVRGGSWGVTALDLPVTNRYGDVRSARDGWPGFRIVLNPAGSP